MNGIVFLIPHSVSSLLAYKIQLISGYFVPATLLNLAVLIVSWWNVWGSLCTVSCHLQIKTVLLHLFQFISFISPCLIAVA